MTKTDNTSSFGSRLWLVCLALPSACADSLAVPYANVTPVADARVLGMDTKNPSFDYNGSKVEVTLDASLSHDPDGTIASYRWLSATLPPGHIAEAAGSGAGGMNGGAAGMSGGTPAMESAAGSGSAENRWVPAGEPIDWPDDVEQPTVMLDQGTWSFALWVIDNRGRVSDPSTVTITISAPLDPEVKACVDTVVPTVKRSCSACVCGVSDECRMAANMSACDASCWGLIQCIGSKCPNFDPNGDPSCLITNCMSYLGAAMSATAIGPCITGSCMSECAQ